MAAVLDTEQGIHVSQKTPARGVKWDSCLCQESIAVCGLASAWQSRTERLQYGRKRCSVSRAVLAQQCAMEELLVPGSYSSMKSGKCLAKQGRTAATRHKRCSVSRKVLAQQCAMEELLVAARHRSHAIWQKPGRRGVLRPKSRQQNAVRCKSCLWSHNIAALLFGRSWHYTCNIAEDEAKEESEAVNLVQVSQQAAPLDCILVRWLFDQATSAYFLLPTWRSHECMPL